MKNTKLVKNLHELLLLATIAFFSSHAAALTHVDGGNPYEDIISQIKKQHFDYVIVPIGSGEFYSCFLEYIKKIIYPQKL